MTKLLTALFALCFVSATICSAFQKYVKENRLHSEEFRVKRKDRWESNNALHFPEKEEKHYSWRLREIHRETPIKISEQGPPWGPQAHIIWVHNVCLGDWERWSQVCSQPLAIGWGHFMWIFSLHWALLVSHLSFLFISSSSTISRFRQIFCDLRHKVNQSMS